MKKLITAALIITLIMTCISTGLTSVFAEGDSTLLFDNSYITVTEDELNTINAWDYTRGDARKEGSHLSFQPGNNAEYDLWVQKAGNYNIYVTYGSGDAAVKFGISLNGTKITDILLSKTESYGSKTVVLVCYTYMEEGLNTVRVENLQGGCYYDAVSFELLQDIAVESIVTDGNLNILEPAVLVPRGCDSFAVKFNQAHDKETVNNETVKLMAGEEEMPADIITDGETVTIKLRKTLDYSAEYSFVIDGVCDTYGMSKVENETVPFTTAGERVRTGTAYLTLESTSFEGRKINLSAEMMSKAEVSIEGRRAEVYALTPTGALIETPVCSELSNKDGKVNLEGFLPENSESGVYTLVISYEYSKADIYLEMVYVSAEKEAELIEILKSASDEAGVGAFFTENQVMLGINIERDTAGIEADKLYAYFVADKPETIEAVIEKYNECIVMEKINQAADESEIIAVLESEEFCGYIGIEKGKADLIVNNKTALAEEIAELGEIKEASLMGTNVNSIIDKWYAEEYGKMLPDSSIKGKSVYVGQSISLDLGFVEAIDDVKEACFVLTAESGSLLEDCIVSAEEPFIGEINIEGNTATVTLISETTQDNVASLGKINLTKTSNKGEWEIQLSGNVKFDVGTEYEVIVPIDEKTVNVSVTVNSQKAESGQSSRPSGTNRGGGSTSIKPVTPSTPEPTKEPESEQKKYEFSDLENADWAKESIYSLLQKGVIAESADKKFNPDSNVTRAEFVKMIVTAFDLTDETAECTLNDVTVDKWYYPYAAAAQKYGLITGNEKGNFNADSSITRQDMSVIIYRACAKLGYAFSKEEFGKAFSDDESILAYAKEAVYTMRILGIINGVGENVFAPEKLATRAQAAKIIHETIKVVGI